MRTSQLTITQVTGSRAPELCGSEAGGTREERRTLEVRGSGGGRGEEEDNQAEGPVSEWKVNFRAIACRTHPSTHHRLQAGRVANKIILTALDFSLQSSFVSPILFFPP